MTESHLQQYLCHLLRSCFPPLFETINDFAQQVSTTYDVVVHWRRNVFLVPYGCAGKEFVQELARLFRSYGEAGALESIAIKAVCTSLTTSPENH